MASELNTYILSHNTSNNIKKITPFWPIQSLNVIMSDITSVILLMYFHLSDSGILGTFMHQGVVLD